LGRATPKHNNTAVVSVNVVRRFMTFSVGRRIPRG
jgi:hypothetical protein